MQHKKPRPGRSGSVSAALASAALAVALSACATSDPEPDQRARTTLNTAPADLQLLCAGAAAEATGAPGDKVLPVSSRQLDSQNYQVEVDANGQRTSCIVDSDGNVKSVQPV